MKLPIDPLGGNTMKMRLLIAAGLLAGLSGCATYDYVGGSSGGYYHGAPSTQYSYPYGYGNYGGYGGIGYGSYGYGSYGYGGYGYGYPGYRPPIYYPSNQHRPPPRPPYGGHGNGNGHRPPPGNGNGNGNGNRPPRPPMPEGGNRSPWRNLDGLQRPQPRANDERPMQRPSQSMATPRPPMQQRPTPQYRPAPAQRAAPIREGGIERYEER